MVRHRALGRGPRDHDVREVDRERLPGGCHDRHGRSRECVYGSLALDIRGQSHLDGRGRRDDGRHAARKHAQALRRARQATAGCARGAQEALCVYRRRARDGPDAGHRVRRRPQNQGAVAQEDDGVSRSGQTTGPAARQGRAVWQCNPHRPVDVDQRIGDRRRLQADRARTRRGSVTLANADLLPVPAERRTWNWWHIASLWIGMAICIPTYTLASGLIDSGWTWQAAVGAVILGNFVVLLPIALNSHAGTRYGIPFPVLARTSFGVLGANIPAILRGLVACGWFGIQTWIGGWASYKLFAGSWARVAPRAPLPPALLAGNPSRVLCALGVFGLSGL